MWDVPFTIWFEYRVFQGVGGIVQNPDIGRSTTGKPLAHFRDVTVEIGYILWRAMRDHI